MNEEAVKATAEAVKATAELGCKTIDAGKSVGTILKAPLTELAGAWEDSVKAWRFQRRVRMLKRTQKFLEEEGITTISPDLPPSFSNVVKFKKTMTCKIFMLVFWQMRRTRQMEPSRGLHMLRYCLK